MRLTELKKRLSDLSDPEAAAFCQRFFKTDEGKYGYGDVFRGIRVPVLRQLAKEYRELTVTEAAQLLRSKHHEDRLVALLILISLYRRGDDIQQLKIYQLYLAHTKFINNWDLVDASAEHIIGPFLWPRDRAPLYRLAASDNLWERRMAIIATFHFIKQREYRETFELAKLLLNDKQDLIHKAVGWMLREIGKKDLAAEQEFLKLHYTLMPRTMLRYAIERFPEDLRQRYLKGSV